MAVYEGETYTVDEYKKLNTATGKEFGKAGEEVIGKQAQDWRNQGSPMPGTNEPEDIRSLGSQLIDWATTPAGNATLGGLGLLVAGATGLKGRKGGNEAPRVEPTFNDPPPPPPPPPSGGGTRTTPPQGNVTDVASRDVPRAGLPTPSAVVPSTTAPAVPPTFPATATQQPTVSGYQPATTNAIPGVPNPVAGSVAPQGAPTPVAPAPVDPLVQAKLDALADKQRRDNEAHAANQRRLDEQHQIKVANEAKRAELGLQKNQGKAASPTSVDQQVMALEKVSDKNKIANSVAQASAPKPIAPAPIAPPVVSSQITPATPAPSPSLAPAPTPATLEPTPRVSATEVPERAPSATQAGNIKEISLPKEWPSKGMNWITSLYGVDGAQQFIDKYNDGKPFKTHAEMQAVYDRVMVKPAFSTMPKELRKERGIKASERDVYKMIPRAVPPPAVGGSAAPVQGGGSLGGTRPGEDFMHSLNPLKL
jgi:hypothetical protein